MLSLLFTLVAGGIFGFVGASFWSARRLRPGAVAPGASVDALYWLNWSASDLTLVPVVYQDESRLEIKAGEQIIPVRLCRVVTLSSFRLFVSGISDAYLSDLVAMRSARMVLDFRAFFLGGGSVRGLLNLVMPLVVIAMSIFVWTQVGSLQNAQVQIISDLGAVKQTVSSPLVCK